MVASARCAVAAVMLAAVSAAIGGCSAEDKPDSPDQRPKIVVYTTFYPTTYFAQRIGGEHVEVVCPLPEDADPIFWMPDAPTIQAYQKADLIVINGAQFEKWVAKVSLPPSRMVDTAKPLKGELITYKDAVEHAHGPSGKHAHEGIDGHTWLDPVNARMQADEIRKALARLAPDRARLFADNDSQLAADLFGLHVKLSELTKAYKGQPILCSHPAYNYIARRYKWNVRNEDLDPETMPPDKQLAAIRKTLEQHPAKFILWESAPKPAVADRLKQQLGLESVEFSPCELLGKRELAAGLDYLKVMHRNIANITPVLRTSATTQPEPSQ